MNIIHELNNQQKTGEGNNQLLLSNKKGSYLLLGEQDSDFDGYFIYDTTTNKPFKIIHDISLQKKPDTIINHLTWVERLSGETKETYTLTSNALIVDIEHYEGTVSVTLDTKRLYDESTTGRVYHAEKKLVDDDCEQTIIHYTKYSDDTLTQKAYGRYIACTTQGAKIELITDDEKQPGCWAKKRMFRDEKRGMQQERWVYDTFRIHVNGSARIIFTSSAQYDKLEEKTEYVLTHQESIINANKRYAQQRFNNKEITTSIAQHALDSLTTKLKNRLDRGVFAGLPWFFQYWMRDEAITCGALINNDQYALVKEILMRWTKKIAHEQTTAHETSTLQSKDGPGIIAKRFHELLFILGKNHKNYFSEQELLFIKQTYDQYLKTIVFDNGLVTNQDKETWMDTAPNNSGRAGKRIEIQCCILNIYSLQQVICSLLKTPNKEYQEREEALKEQIKQQLFVNDQLIDGLDKDNQPDHTIRPNMFLAHYLYPELLTKKEWEQTIDKTLPQLWLSWGGLSSVSKEDQRFQPIHTGINNHSYHHGDSWYFINNIAAITLFIIEPHKYYEYIDQLVCASKKDLLFLGTIGHSSEISGAQRQESNGCVSQAWSAATLIELLLLLRGEHKNCY